MRRNTLISHTQFQSNNMSHIPNPIDDLFIPELKKKIEQLNSNATHEDVVEMMNELIEVMNHVVEILSGGGEVNEERS